MKHTPDTDDVRRMIRREIADALRALAASSYGNGCTMCTARDLEHVANIVDGKVAQVKP